jgi:hypothetical protein
MPPAPRSRRAFCRAGQKLTQRHQISIGGFIEPFASRDKLLAKIAEMGDRTAERGQPESEGNGEDFKRV